jgi:hypothetical protein
MKKKSSVIGAITFICLILSLGLTKQKALASRWTTYRHPREVKVIKPIKIYKMKFAYPLYKTHAIGSKTLKKGQKVKIQIAASYEWIVTHKGWSNGYFKHGGKYFWQCPTPTGWYKLVK